MAAEHEFTAMASQADAALSRVEQSRLRRLYEWRKNVELRNAVAAYRGLFLDAAGALRPEAIAVIADFSRVARLGIIDLPAMSDGELREHAGRRTLALHILGRLDLDGSRLRDLGRKLREPGHE